MTLLPFAWVRRATAAAAVTATVRSFLGRCRQAKLRNLCDIRLRARCVVVVQRWWRWSVCMRHRLVFLSSLRTSLHALGGGKILMAERQTLENLDIDRADNSSQLLLETKCEPAVAAGTGARILLKAVKFDMMCKRRMVPKWVNFDSESMAESTGNSEEAWRTTTSNTPHPRKPVTCFHARVRAQPCNHHRYTARRSPRAHR